MLAKNHNRLELSTWDSHLRNLPLKVLLDTSVVQNMERFGEYIYDNYLSRKLSVKLNGLPKTLQEDIEALKNIFGPIERSPVLALVSTLSLNELSKTRKKEKRERLVRWGLNLLEYSDEITENYRISLSEEQVILSDFIKDKIDRSLLGECRRMNCQAFITMDYKTILRFSRRLKLDDRINALSPSEWWSFLEPWWALWV